MPVARVNQREKLNKYCHVVFQLLQTEHRLTLSLIDENGINIWFDFHPQIHTHLKNWCNCASFICRTLHQYSILNLSSFVSLTITLTGQMFPWKLLWLNLNIKMFIFCKDSARRNSVQNKLISGTSSNTYTRCYKHTRCAWFPSPHVKLNRRMVVWEAQQAARPCSHHKHLNSELCATRPPVTSPGLDKCQVALKRVSIHRHAELHLGTLLQSGGGLQGRVGNVDTGRSADCQNMSETGKQAWHKEVHSFLCAAIKRRFCKLEDLDGRGWKR